ncbi:MAG: XRE family transcriptional regulator [Lentisphaeria bacterium]|nr:XRE family transcriptional regulator [Lentisphaeria bacterium]
MPTNDHIGGKIKDLREMRNVSLEELSARTGLETALLQRIEAGDVPLSLSPLQKIARGLGCRLGTFLDDSNLSGPVVSEAVESSDDQSLRFTGGNQNGLLFHALSVNKADRSMEPFIVEVMPATAEKYELSSHEGEEFIYVLEGVIEVAYGKKFFQVKKGQSIYYDSIVPHHLHAAGSEAAKILAVIYSPK